MIRLKELVMVFSFLGLAGFILGIGFLFLINVPVEAFMKRSDMSQRAIDMMMNVLIILYGVTAGILTIWFNRRLVIDSRKHKTAAMVLGLLLLTDGLAFATLISTDSALVNGVSGSSTVTSTHTFGPYPDEKQLAELKEQGYSGVITLLNPAIPFEKLLLDRELEAGRKLGIQVYSFPMLPWVSENKESLENIKQIVRTTKGSFYFHCYLGKHRVDMVRQMVTREFGDTPLREDVFLLPDHLERGNLIFHEAGRIIIGPFPTDEEWFNILSRGRVRNVISVLDPEKPEDLRLIEKERKACADLGLNLILYPVKNSPNMFGQVTGLETILATTKGRTYIHGFRIDERSMAIDSWLRFNTVAPDTIITDEDSVANGVYQVNRNIVLGIRPLNNIRSSLENWGTTSVIEINFTGVLPASVKAGKVIERLEGQKGVFYIQGFKTRQEMVDVASVIRGRFYGIDKNAFSDVNTAIPVNVVNRMLVVGVEPEKGQLDTLTTIGINTFIYVSGRDDATPAYVEEFKKRVEAFGVKFVIVNYGDGYEKKITSEVNKFKGPCYVVVPARAQHQITRDLKALKLT